VSALVLSGRGTIGRDVLNMIVNFLVPYKSGDFLTSPASARRRALLPEVCLDHSSQLCAASYQAPCLSLSPADLLC
jgi:hypothetical protein